MKRKAFILTEILTGLLLQAGFAVTLCGAFYMLVTFSSSVSSALSSNSQGQRVITYIEHRIINAGLGFRKCNSPAKIAEAMEIGDTYFKQLKGLHLPVAIMSNTDSKGEIVSYDGRYYEGNVLNLLYAKKDNTPNELLVFSTEASTDMITIPAASSDTFRFLFNKKDYTASVNTGDDSHNASDLTLKGTDDKKKLNRWAVMEASGVPVRISDYSKDIHDKFKFKLHAPTRRSVEVYPMSELLNLCFEKMYVTKNASGDRNFVFQLPKDGLNDGMDSIKYQASDILEIYMKLDTKPDYDATLHLPPVPIFDLKVLVNTGEQVTVNDEIVRTSCPDNWPKAYWKEEFELHNVQVLETSWKLYNLAGFTFGTTP